MTATRGDPVARVRRGSDRFLTDTGWATTRSAFSFGAHYDPDNVGFGRLLVCNEDLVRTGCGYPPHPHENAEIVTWVLSGSLVHRDTFGNTGIVRPGLAQRMSAGSGIVHSERNDAFTLHADLPPEPVHFLQMWVRPDRLDGTPGYAQREIAMTDLARDWVPVASGGHADAAVDLHATGCTLWVTTLSPGVSRLLPESNRVYLQVTRGEVDVETVGALLAGDVLMVTGRAALTVAAAAPGPEISVGSLGAEVLVWAMDE